MNEPEHDASAEAGVAEAPADLVEAPPPPAFPWPPRDGDSPLSAFLNTIEHSVRHAPEFFRMMPRDGYSAALAYFIPIGVLAAGVRLFWLTIFDTLGYSPFGSLVATPGDRLIDFLLSPIALIATLFVAAALVHASLKLIGGAHAPFVTTMRVIAFSSAPQLCAVVPFLGGLAATIGTLVLVVIGLREAHSTTTGRALTASILPFVALLCVLVITLVLIVLIRHQLGWRGSCGDA